jgi:hypothetical protein
MLWESSVMVSLHMGGDETGGCGAREAPVYSGGGISS